ncbi:heat shock 70 kDa protein 14 [Stomoxys calcitrans]|uniref:Heat shock 70 kDa protein 14 n=1 Tax=Stomoxys calcitrans TaxID=35570 RepID=A0A1I8PMN8_STOCA|nr:heat shock 70 kDa protein 14 [Stomoxys calcitrans]
MWPRFGIKVGNSTLCIAQVKPTDTKPDVIANKQGDRTSQACLLWDGMDEIECGLTANQKMSSKPKQAVANSFQLLKDAQDITEEFLAKARKAIPCEYDGEKQKFVLKAAQPTDNDEDKEVTKEMSAFEVQVKLFESELELAKQYHNEAGKPTVVLSIPSYYSDKSWSLLAQAAEKAGFHVAQIVDEPTAAILAYGIGEEVSNDESKFVWTIKCGGLYSHFALYEVRHGLYTKIECFGPFPIGGQQFTEELVKFICEEFQRKYKLDPHESRRSLAKIRTAAANCKHILTTLPSTQLYIDSLMDGVDFNVQMSRARFESLIQPVINSFMQTLGENVDKALKNHPRVKKIDSIVLLGATTQIPKLQSAISARYPDAEVNSSISADEVVAVGCARQTLFLEDSERQILEASEECECVEEEVTIWHGTPDDDADAQKLLNPGDVLPKTVVLNIKLKETSLGSETFQLRFGSQTVEVNVHKAESSIEGEGFVRLEAEIEKAENSAPLVRLKCI